jgi:hypothetical protein
MEARKRIADTRSRIQRIVWKARARVIAEQLASMKRAAIVAPSFVIVDFTETELRALHGDR